MHLFLLCFFAWCNVNFKQQHAAQAIYTLSQDDMLYDICMCFCLNHIVFLRVSDRGARVLIKKNFQKYAKIPNLWVE